MEPISDRVYQSKFFKSANNFTLEITDDEYDDTLYMVAYMKVCYLNPQNLHL